MSVRVGIIGVGVMGRDHADLLATQVPGVTLQAIHDADPARAEAVAEETGAKAVMADPLMLIENPAIDAVLLASPDTTHKELTLACIAARKPVLCEKPLAPTSCECLEVVAAETKLGRRLAQIGYMRRFDPSYVEMKSLLTGGSFGRPLLLHCIHRNVSAPAWFDDRMAIGNSAVHEFDIIRWLLDTELLGMHVFRPRAAAPDSARPLLLIVETRGGQVATVEVFNNAAYGYDVRGELVCQKGTVKLRAPVRTETNLALRQGIEHPADWRPRFADAYRLQAQAWVRAIGKGAFVGATAWDGYAAARAAEAGLLSLAVGRYAEIEPGEKPAIYR